MASEPGETIDPAATAATGVDPDAARSQASSSRERRDLVSGEVMEEGALIRFVAAPDGTVAPDLAAKLPGRGLWVAASRASVETAVKRNLFSRAAKTALKPAPDLADVIERLLAKRCLEQLGLARREGVLAAGFEKTQMAVRSGKAAWVIDAADGSADGRRKLLGAAARAVPQVRVCGAFGAEELGLALGLGNVIHLALLAGRRAERWTQVVDKLAGFRPLLPESWREEARSGRSV